MKKDKMFTPLNISYPIQKYSNMLLLGILLAIIAFIGGIILTFKVSSYMMFSPIFGSRFFKIAGVLISLYLGIFIFRKVGLKEHELMRLYDEMIDHEVTTINDLWDIIALDGPIATYQDDSCKIFIKCEKGYVISRPSIHEEQHRKCFEMFLNELFNRGYYVDYYNWHNRDGNTAPLDVLEEKLGSNPNNFLREYGNSTIKLCRELSYCCTSSEVEYFVVTCRDRNSAAYLEPSVISAVENLQGSLYTDIRICEMDGIVEFLEEVNKIKGININDMLKGNALKTSQRVIKILDVYGDMSDDIETTSSNVENSEEVAELMEAMEAVTNTRNKRGKQNLLHRDNLTDRKARPVDTNNIIDEDSIPIPIDDDDEDSIPIPINDDEDSIPMITEDSRPVIVEDDSEHKPMLVEDEIPTVPEDFGESTDNRKRKKAKPLPKLKKRKLHKSESEPIFMNNAEPVIEDDVNEFITESSNTSSGVIRGKIDSTQSNSLLNNPDINLDSLFFDDDELISDDDDELLTDD